MKTIRLSAILMLLLFGSALTSCDSSTDPGDDKTYQVYSTSETINGKTYGQWAGEWWKQMFTTPGNENPLLDSTGSSVLKGLAAANNEVLFLAGVFNTSGTAVRTATIPAGKSLFFPIINFVYDSVEVSPVMTPDAMQQALAERMATVKDMSVTIDGQSVPDLNSYRAIGERFSYTTGPDHIWGYRQGMRVADVVSDGYYLGLKPLSKGAHTIRIKGAVADEFHLDVTYHLTVE